jgi:hypothetical protein
MASSMEILSIQPKKITVSKMMEQQCYYVMNHANCNVPSLSVNIAKGQQSLYEVKLLMYCSKCFF